MSSEYFSQEDFAETWCHEVYRFYFVIDRRSFVDIAKKNLWYKERALPKLGWRIKETYVIEIAGTFT